MAGRGLKLVAVVLVLAFSFVGCSNTAVPHAEADPATAVRYTFIVDQLNASRHMAHVALSLSPESRSFISLGFRTVIGVGDGLQVNGFSALDENGNQLKTTFSIKDGKKSWAVQASRVQQLRVLYDVEMDFVRGPTLDRAYAGYLTGTFGVAMASWVFLVPDLTTDRIEVRFDLPEGWSSATPWQAEGEHYWASSVDFFVSSVFAVGRLEQQSRVVAGTNVTVAVFSDWPQLLKWSLAEYSFQAYDMLTELFGKPIQDRYLSIYTPTADDGGDIGWLEWTQAQACTIDPHGNAVFGALQGILHRAFHNWNAFPPYGMSQKSDEESWFREGVNRYYDDDKIPIELGIFQRHWVLRYRFEDYLNLIVGAKYDVPVAYSSRFDNSEDADYYLRLTYHKGSLVAFLLDEVIRSLTQDKSSLDLVLARLYERYGTPESARSYLESPSWSHIGSTDTRRYSNADILAEVNYLTGKDLSKFFDLYIYGKSQLPLKLAGDRDLEVDWLKLSQELELTLLAPPAINPRQVTVGRFKLDGASSDWDGIASIIKDHKGDARGGRLSTDLKAVYAVYDREYLYIMVQTWDRPDPGNGYITPVDIDGDDQWEYSFGFDMDNVWMYDLRGISKGQWPTDRQSSPMFPHRVDEVAEITIPLSLIAKPTKITIWAWINNGGMTVDEAAQGSVSYIEGYTTTTTQTVMLTSTSRSTTSRPSILPTTAQLETTLETESSVPPQQPYADFLTNRFLLVAGVVLAVVTVALAYLRTRRKHS